MEYLIAPVAKPRMTRGDKWRKIPRKPVGKYWAFCRRCQLLKMELPLSNASVTFIVPMAESWSKKKRKQFDGKPHQPKGGPDLDNFLKALGDALYKNDSCIWDVHIRKVWGYEGKIIIDQSDMTRGISYLAPAYETMAKDKGKKGR
jgi:Holliday junction resolvase RusA-like endonuclease